MNLIEFYHKGCQGEDEGGQGTEEGGDGTTQGGQSGAEDESRTAPTEVRSPRRWQTLKTTRILTICVVGGACVCIFLVSFLCTSRMSGKKREITNRTRSTSKF